MVLDVGVLGLHRLADEPRRLVEQERPVLDVGRPAVGDGADGALCDGVGVGLDLGVGGAVLGLELDAVRP